MKNKKVLVVLGGTSGEREVSLDTGRACIKALKKLGHKVSTHDTKKKSLSLILCFRNWGSKLIEQLSEQSLCIINFY